MHMISVIYLSFISLVFQVNYVYSNNFKTEMSEDVLVDS